MKISLLQIGIQPELIQKLDNTELKEAWDNAVKLHTDASVLCARFEKEWLRRQTDSNTPIFTDSSEPEK